MIAAIIFVSVLVYLIGVFLGIQYVSFGDTQWYDRPIMWFWPVTLPVIFLCRLLYVIFWAG